MPPLKALTFDLWDTLVVDDSDEPLRQASGLRSKKDERRHLLWEALNRDSTIAAEHVQLAYDVADAAFNHVWHEQYVTWTIRERLDVILAGLNRTLPAEVLNDVVAAHERMEVDIPPSLIEGCSAALASISERFQLAIVSDAIVTPGRCLRQVLRNHGIEQYFRGFAFSDEVGHSKPHRSMFDSAAAQLGVAIDEMLHIGDREHNDIRGAHAVGMRAILFTASRAVDRDRSQAEAICDSYEKLPAILERIADEP